MMIVFVATLLLLHTGRSPAPAAGLLCTAVVLAVPANALLNKDISLITHAIIVMSPAFAVYLLGSRRSIFIVALTLAVLGVTPTLLQAYSPGALLPPRMWHVSVAAGLTVLSIWVLGALHSAAHDHARAALEGALQQLRDRERKLRSLFENTDDMVCSLDADGRVLIANAALTRAYARRFGKEPAPGEPLLADMTARNRDLWAQALGEALAGQRSKFEADDELDGERRVLEVVMDPIRDDDARPVGATLFARDITDRKQAEDQLRAVHRTLVDISRQAGMAELASSVLHNIGNALNSINVSVHLVSHRLRKLRAADLGRVAALLEKHAADLATFLTQDRRGKQLPSYLQALSRQITGEQEVLLREMDTLGQGVTHIESIVHMQQAHARTVEAVEQLSLPQLVDEALHLQAITFERLGIAIERDYADVPPVLGDRHKLLQILIHLLSNARHALLERQDPDRRLTLRVQHAPAPQHLCIEVADNGAGIPPENLSRLFRPGFTTKEKGHGYGLHVSALAAMEMNARLTCASSGPGQGATFTLELPVTRAPEAQA